MDFDKFLKSVNFVGQKKTTFELIKQYRDKYRYLNELKPRIRSSRERVLHHPTPDINPLKLCQEIFGAEIAGKDLYTHPRDLPTRRQRWLKGNSLGALCVWVRRGTAICNSVNFLFLRP